MPITWTNQMSQAVRRKSRELEETHECKVCYRERDSKDMTTLGGKPTCKDCVLTRRFQC